MTEKEILYKIYLALRGHLSEVDLNSLFIIITEKFGDSLVIANKLQKLTRQFERSFNFEILEKSFIFAKKLDNFNFLNKITDVSEAIMIKEPFSDKAIKHYENYIELLLKFNSNRIDSFETKLISKLSTWDLLVYANKVPISNKRKIFGQLMQMKQNDYAIKQFIIHFPEYKKFVPLM